MFLFVFVADVLGMFITSRFHAPGNFAETALRIMASPLLYRAGLSCGLIGSRCTVFLATGLYVVVKPIDNNLALLGLSFRLAEATLGGAGSILGFSALKLYAGGDYGNAFAANQLAVLASLFSSEWNIGAIYFGIGSIFFFYLFFRSTYIPKALAALGLFGSVLVPIVSFGCLLSPQHTKMLQFGWIPMALAELSVGLWLLIKGVKLRLRDTGIRT